jgi:hypothetical protein
MIDRPHTFTPEDLGVTYFSPGEFNGWWPLIDPRWLVCADILREMSGLIIDVSPVDGAIGRRLGESSLTDHNVDRFGRVHAVDVLPRWLVATSNKITISRQAQRFSDIAQDVGFTAIGYYPDWRNAKGKKNPGFHLGTRRSRRVGSPATWGRLKNESGDGYTDITMAVALNVTESRLS